MKKVVIGIIGSGFAADLHGCAYGKVYGIEAVIKAVASLDPGVTAFAEKFGIPDIYSDYHEMLEDTEIELIDIIAPPYLHAGMVTDIMRRGKHVICEKPLTGYFGGSSNSEAASITKAEMYETVVRDLKRLKKEVEASGCKFMYAENYIYTPAVVKCVEFLKSQKPRILFMRAEESHNGSHASHAAYWKYSGGGSFIRQGCHPLSAVLYLKRQEAQIRGIESKVTSILADVGNVTQYLTEEERVGIDNRAVDVEDLANVILTFSDGTKAVITAGDMVVGGVKNLVEIYTNKSVYHCNMAATDGLRVYHDKTAQLDDVSITEKVGTKTGWQKVCLEEEMMRGYLGELQDFVECVAYDRQPISDFALAEETIALIYAAYWSAEEGRRVDFVSEV